MLSRHVITPPSSIDFNATKSIHKQIRERSLSNITLFALIKLLGPNEMRSREGRSVDHKCQNE